MQKSTKERTTETAMAMETATVTATVMTSMPMPTQHIKDSDKDNMPGICHALVAVAAMSVVRGGSTTAKVEEVNG